MVEVEIKVDADRMADLITVDEYLGMEENNYKHLVNVLSKFVVDDDGEWMPFDEGRAIIGQLSLRELGDLSREFVEAAKEAVVPQG